MTQNLSYLDSFFGPAVPRYLGTDGNKRPTVEYVGAGVVVSDDTVNNRTIVTIAGAGTFGAGVATWLTTPSSANLLAALTDETGTGLLVFNTAPTFKTTITLRNPADTFSYIFTPAAIVANRVVTMPLLAGNDTLVCEAFAQTLTNKTVVLASNTITDTSAATGDVMRHNGTKFVRLARGTANQVLAVNGGGTDIAWATAPGGLGTNVLSGTSFISIGVNPAAVGGLRMANALAITGRNLGNTADFNFCNVDASNQINVGDAGAGTSISGTYVQLVSSGSLYLYAASAQAITDDGTTTSMAHPIVGLGTAWGAVDGQVQVAVAAANITLSSVQYNTKIQKFTGAPAAQRTITYPLPADDAHSYVKIIWCQTTVSGIVITNTGGLTVTLVINDAPHVLLFTPTGVVKIT